MRGPFCHCLDRSPRARLVDRRKSETYSLGVIFYVMAFNARPVWSGVIEQSELENATKFHKEMSAARSINSSPNSKKMYNAIAHHGGEAGHLATYINETVRTGDKPTAFFFAFLSPH